MPESLIPCYCPLCTENGDVYTAISRTKRYHHKQRYSNLVDRPFSTQFYNVFEQGASSAHPEASSNFANEADLDVSMASLNISIASIHLDSDESEIVSIYFCSIIILADIWTSNMNKVLRLGFRFYSQYVKILDDSWKHSHSDSNEDSAEILAEIDTDVDTGVSNHFDIDPTVDDGDGDADDGDAGDGNAGDGDAEDGEAEKVVIDGCLDPLDLDNAVPPELAQDHPETDENIFSDIPDPGSQANLEAESRSPEPEPPYDDLGPDIDELLDIVKLEDLDLQLRFIKEIKNASLEDDGMRMDEEDLERLRNPLDHELTLDNTSDLRLTLELFIANINSPVEVYNANRAAIL